MKIRTDSTQSLMNVVHQTARTLLGEGIPYRVTVFNAEGKATHISVLPVSWFATGFLLEMPGNHRRDTVLTVVDLTHAHYVEFEYKGDDA